MKKILLSTDSKKKENAGGKNQYSFFVVLFSVFVALVLWFYVQEAEAPDYKKTFTDVTVKMQSLSSSFSVIEGGDNRVDVTLMGKRSDLNKIKASDLEAYMDLSKITQPGNYQPEISVLVPKGTELFGCFPQVASLYVDQTLSVSLPVVVEMGEYTTGTDVGVEAKSAVEEITVKGPKSVLDEIDCAKVKTGKLGEIRASFESNLDYELYNKNGDKVESRHIITPEKNVLVKFTVYKTKTVPFTLETKNGFWEEGDMKYTVSPKTVTVKGEPALIDSLESIPALILDEKQVDSTRYTETLTSDKIILPDGVSFAETLGDVKVNLNLTDNSSRTLKMKLDSGHVAVTPPEDGLEYSFSATSLSFKIRGKQAEVSRANLDDFYLNIDLSEVTEAGEAEVPVQIVQTSATEGKFYPVGEYTVKVIFTEEKPS